jgi:hypothetical protein
MTRAMMLLTPACMAAMTLMAQTLVAQTLMARTLVAQAGPASTSAAPREDGTTGQVQAAPAVRTGKERLGGKASDEQRVDNCKVPPGLRGSTPRPDDCGDRTTTPSGRR